MLPVAKNRRLSFIILRSHVAPVELWLGVQDIIFAAWLLAQGGDETYRATILFAQQFLPISTGRAILAGIVVLAFARIWSCVEDLLWFRRWIARLFAFHWLAVLYAFLIAEIHATELPLYAFNCCINLWLQFRLDERYYRSRRTRGRAVA